MVFQPDISFWLQKRMDFSYIVTTESRATIKCDRCSLLTLTLPTKEKEKEEKKETNWKI